MEPGGGFVVKHHIGVPKYINPLYFHISMLSNDKYRVCATYRLIK